jgi:gamma-glutamyltranspeptidase/glutathione hydrolase
VGPLVLYSARENQVISRTGAGPAPALATLENFLEHGKSVIRNAIVPADVDNWCAVLERYGTISFEEAAQYALDVAENGYHIDSLTLWLISSTRDAILKWPYNTEFWFQMGVDKQKLGDILVNKDLGKLIRYMIDAERRTLASGGTRSDGIWAARNAFYKGEPAKAVDKVYTENGGLMRYEDFANYQGDWEKPLHTTYRGYDIYAGQGSSQTPRIILFLNMLENFDLQSLGYNTPEYIHLISQVIDLGMIDCHKYIGDPDFADTPVQLWSKEYAQERIKLIDMEKAFEEPPPWGDPRQMKNIADDAPKSFVMKGSPELAMATNLKDDTTSLNVMDAEGNIFSMTESDGHMSEPMIPGWGFGIATRGSQFNLDPTLANVIAPNKRPRNTNGPWLVMKDGKPFMGISTPGGDQQEQGLLQVFLNVVEWGMNPQQALDQPRFGSENYIATGTDSGVVSPGALCYETRIPEETIAKLKEMGHIMQSWGLWSWVACNPTITYRDPETGIMRAASDVRREGSALGW